jgi:hypothetical protein
VFEQNHVRGDVVQRVQYIGTPPTSVGVELTQVDSRVGRRSGEHPGGEMAGGDQVYVNPPIRECREKWPTVVRDATSDNRDPRNLPGRRLPACDTGFAHAHHAERATLDAITSS